MTANQSWSAAYDSVRDERVGVLQAFRLTERQARFLVTVMVHSGSLLERQYCAFTGTARGQNSREFVARLVARGYATAVIAGSVRRGRIYYVHYKPLYEAIGLPDDRNRRRQSIGRMVQGLMILDAVLADRTCWWMSPERDKRSYFLTTERGEIRPSDFPQIAFGTSHPKTVRYFPDKLPIGIDKHELYHHVFLYLVTRRLPVDFRQFLLRHADLLRALHQWTIRILVPRRFWRAAALYKAAVREELWTPLEPNVSDRLGAYFRSCQATGGHLSEPSDDYLVKAMRRYGRARFASLYKAWRQRGDSMLWTTHSPRLRDSRELGFARCEVQLLTGQYLRLTRAIDAERGGTERGQVENARRLTAASCKACSRTAA